MIIIDDFNSNLFFAGEILFQHNHINHNLQIGVTFDICQCYIWNLLSIYIFNDTFSMLHLTFVEYLYFQCNYFLTFFSSSGTGIVSNLCHQTMTMNDDWKSRSKNLQLDFFIWSCWGTCLLIYYLVQILSFFQILSS